MLQRAMRGGMRKWAGRVVLFIKWAKCEICERRPIVGHCSDGPGHELLPFDPGSLVRYHSIYCYDSFFCIIKEERIKWVR